MARRSDVLDDEQLSNLVRIPSRPLLLSSLANPSSKVMLILEESLQNVVADVASQVHREKKMERMGTLQEEAIGQPSKSPSNSSLALAPDARTPPQAECPHCERVLKVTTMARHLEKCMRLPRRQNASAAKEPARMEGADLERGQKGGGKESLKYTDSDDTSGSCGGGKGKDKRNPREPEREPVGQSKGEQSITQQVAFVDPPSFNQPSIPTGTGTEESSAEQPATRWTVSTATALYERAIANGENGPLHRWRLRLRNCVASFLEEVVQGPVVSPSPAALVWESDADGFPIPKQKWAHE